MTDQKTKQTWTVIQTATESEIKNIGGNLWIKAHKKLLLLSLIFALIIGGALSGMTYSIRAGYVGAIMIAIFVGIYFMYRAGSVYLKTVRDKTTIDLREKKDEAKK